MKPVMTHLYRDEYTEYVNAENTPTIMTKAATLTYLMLTVYFAHNGTLTFTVC